MEGQHYQILTPTVATGRSQDVVVTEFFWYGCGHCYTFEPMLTAWGKQLPEGAVVQPSPAVWNDGMKIHAKAYYIAEVLGVKETVHPIIFDAMHVKRERLSSRLALRDLFEDSGVDPVQFDKAFDSFGVDSQVRQADARAKVRKNIGNAFFNGGGKIPHRDTSCGQPDQYVGHRPVPR